MEPQLGPDSRRHLFDQFLRCLDREDNLVHYRMTWGLQWNAGLFAALITIVATIKSSSVVKDIAILILLVTGVAASILSVIAIRAAHKQINFLIEDLERRLEIYGKHWGGSEFIRPYGDPNSVHLGARRVTFLFPLIFVILWIVALFYIVKSHVALTFLVQLT